MMNKKRNIPANRKIHAESQKKKMLTEKESRM